MPISEIEVAALADRVAEGALVIDVREPDEYEAGHVPGALLIPLATVPDHLDRFRADQPTYVICKSGGRSHAGLRDRCRRGLRRRQRHGRNRRVDRLGRDVVIGRHTTVTFRWVDDEIDFLDLIDQLILEPRYALDTEFHRERTYFPRLALVQVGWPGGIALIDPLAIDPGLFTKLFESDAVAVLHAAQQDLDVLSHAVGGVPRVIYDTQVAAGFIGYATPSLVELVRGELGQSPAKGDRLTDWLHRPLTADQKDYAAADVRYLLDLQDHIDAKLIDRGRLAWAVEAFDELRTAPDRSHGPGGRLGTAEGRQDPPAPVASGRPGGRRVAGT